MLRREHAITATEPGLAVLFTGNTASGKSTLAKELEEQLIRKRHVVMRLDGENLRHGLCGDLGFSMEDRDENLRRMAEVAVIARQHGVHVIMAAVAPLTRHIEQFQAIVGDDLVRVFMDTDESVCRERDSKGVYAMADEGKALVPGVNADWEPDVHASWVVDAGITDAANVAKDIFKSFVLGATKWDLFFKGMSA